MHRILVIRLYFPLDALHVSDSISPSSGATLQAVHRIWYMPVYADMSGCCLTIATQQPDYGTGIYRHIPNAMYSL